MMKLLMNLKFYLNHYLGWFGKGFWKGTNSTVLESLFPLSAAQILVLIFMMIMI